jgi:hypothetical protein
MKRLKEIKLNDFQVNVLLSDEEKSGYQYLLDNGVYCTQCQGICKKGIVKTAVKLNSLNDIMVEGNCRECGHKVARVMEFGEDRSFFEKAVNFRESLQN